MKIIYLIPAAMLMGAVCMAQHLKPVAKKIMELKSQHASFTEVNLFDLTLQSQQRNARLSDVVSDGSVMEFRQHDAQAVLSAQPENIRFIIPTGAGAGIVLELYRSSIFTPDFHVVTSASNGQPVPYKGGIHYWGIIDGDYSSVAAISIFDEEVMGIISSPSAGNFVLGKLKNAPSGMHLFYNEKDLHASPPVACYTPNDQGSYSQKDLQPPSRRSMTNCIRIYWEVNDDIYTDKGSIANATNYVAGLFNESAVIYTNDAIPVELSQVFVWNTTSPYTSSVTSTLLNQFQSYRNSFNGDLGTLLGYAGGGGIAAGFSALCASNLNSSQCYSGISSTYQTVPVFSWSVDVITHEQGHLMGSRHTHACVWNGNNTAIDGCGPAAGFSYEGNCSGAPVPPAGGTIMSYCHLVNAGINFSLGFGSQPAAVILNNYNNATCLSPCSGGSFCSASSNASTINIDTTSATFNWAAVTGAVSYNIQYRIAGTSIWSMDTTSNTSYVADSLTPGTHYEWQVQTVCSAGTSVFTSSEFFITVPLTCDPPAGLMTINITSVTANFAWNSPPGAISYAIRYRITGSPTWTTGTSTITSYHAMGLVPGSNYEWQVQTVCSGGGTSSFSVSELFTTLGIGVPVTIILQPDAECGNDAVIADCVPCGYSVMNYGNSPEWSAIAWTNLGSNSDSRSLIQFDLSAIPTGSAVQSAFLSLYFDPTSSNGQHSTLSGPNDAYLMEITSPWNENTVTWVNQPGTDTLNQVHLPPSTSPTQDYLNIDVAAIIQDFVNNPSQNYGMMIQLATEQHYRSLIFSSSDHSNPALHPKLEITYAPNNTGCLRFQYSNCNGTDAVIANCTQCGYDVMNFGASPEFNAVAWTNGGNISDSRSLIYWDFTSIPAIATVTSANVSLFWNPTSGNIGHSTISGANDAYLLKVTSPWMEDSVTWNNQPTVSVVNQAYLPASTNAQQDYTTIDVTALVQDMVSNPSANYGLMLKLATEMYYRSLIFASSDHADQAKHPQIDICYTIPTGFNAAPARNHLSVQEDFAAQTISVISPGNFEPGTRLLLYNATGQLIRKFENLSGRSFVFNWSNFAGGIYFYRIESKSEFLNGKLIFR